MIRIEVKSTTIRKKEGTKEGKPWEMNFQQIYVHGYYQDGFPADTPRATTIQLEDRNGAPTPYPVGFYAISDESLYFGNFDRITLGRLKLVPLGSYMAEAVKQVQAMQPTVKAAA